MENFNSARRQREFRSATKFIDKEADYNRFTTIPTDEELLASDCAHSGAAEHDLVEVWCERFNPLDPRLRVSISKWDFFLFLFSTWWKDYDILRVPEGPLYYALLNDLKYHAKGDKMRTFTASRYDIGPHKHRSDESITSQHQTKKDENNNNVMQSNNKQPRKIKENKQAVKVDLTHYYLADPENFSDTSQLEAEDEGEFEEDYPEDGNTSAGSVLSLQLSLASEPIMRPLCHLSPLHLFKKYSFDSLLFEKEKEKRKALLPSCQIFSNVRHKKSSHATSSFLESQSQLNSLQYEKRFSSSYGFTQVRSRRSTIAPLEGMHHANTGYGPHQHYHMPSLLQARNSVTTKSPKGKKKKPKKLTLEEECESVRSTPPELDLDQSFYNESIAAYFGYIRKGFGDLAHLCPISSFYTLPPEEEEEGEEEEEETPEAMKRRLEKEKRLKLDEFLRQLKPEVVSDWEDDEPEMEITKCTEKEKKTLKQHFRKRSSVKKTEDTQDECDIRCTSPSLKNYIKSRQDKWEKQMAEQKEASAASKVHPYKVTAEQYGLYSDGVCGEEVPLKFKYIKNKPKRVKKTTRKHFKKHDRKSTIKSESVYKFIDDSSSDEEEQPISYKTPGEEWIENNLKPDSKTTMNLTAVKSSQYKDIMNFINTDTKHEIAMPTKTWAAYHLYGLDRLKDKEDIKVKTHSKMIKTASQIAHEEEEKAEEEELPGKESVEDKHEKRISVLEEVEEEECDSSKKRKKKMKEGRDLLTLRQKKMEDDSTISSVSSGEEAVEEEEIPTILIEIEKNIHGIPLSAFYCHHQDAESDRFLKMLLRRAKKANRGSETDSNDEKEKGQEGEGGGGGKHKGRMIYKRKFKTGVKVLGRGSKGSRYIARKARLKKLSVVQPAPEIKLKRLDSLEMHKEIANYVLCKHFNENNGGITISRRLQEDKKLKGVPKTALPYCHEPSHFDSIFCIPGGDFKMQILEAAKEFVIRREVVVTGTIRDMPIASLAFVRKLKCVYGYPTKLGSKNKVFELPELIETMKITS